MNSKNNIFRQNTFHNYNWIYFRNTFHIYKIFFFNFLPYTFDNHCASYSTLKRVHSSSLYSMSFASIALFLFVCLLFLPHELQSGCAKRRTCELRAERKAEEANERTMTMPKDEILTASLRRGRQK